MKKVEKQFVAMTHEICPICGKETNEGIMIHTRFGDLSEIHNKATGFSKEPCEECQVSIKAGAIMVIVVDEDKSGDHSLKEMYRTGEVYGVKEKVIKGMLKDGAFKNAVLVKRAMVMDYKIAKHYGFPVKYQST